MSEQREIYLNDIVDILKRRKRFIIIITSVAALIGLLYAAFSTPLYKAPVTIQPVVEDGSGLGGVKQSLGSVAALAGINLGGGSANQEEYLAILQSRELAERFIERYNLKPHLFPDRWDVKTTAWKQGKPSFIGRMARAVSGLLAKLSGDEGWRETREPEPSNWEAYKEFLEITDVSRDTQTGLVVVSFEFRNPELAAKWANGYIALANEEIRTQSVAEANRALAYLDNQVKTVSVSGLRETIFDLIESQLELVMQANARSEFAFKVIDQAVAPEERSHPKRVLIVLLALLIGLMLGVFIALIDSFLKQQKSVTTSSNNDISVADAKFLEDGLG